MSALPRRSFLVALVVMAGCWPKASGLPLELDGPAKVLVLPFGLGGSLDASGRFVPQQSGTPLPSELSANAQSLLSSGLAESGVTQVYVVTAAGATRDATTAAHSARDAGANLAVIGAVLRFREREGPALGASQPASVAYMVELVRASDGAVVSVEEFDFTQQTLSSNVLQLPRFLEGGGRWVTRQEMLAGALRDTARRLAAVIRGESPPRPPRRSAS